MIRFDIPGMTCGGCARTITVAIHSVDAQARVDIDVAARTLDVETGADRDTLAGAIREAGYEVATG